MTDYPARYRELLGWLSGYEGQTQPVEVPPAVLVAAEIAIRHLVERAAALDALEEWLRGKPGRNFTIDWEGDFWARCKNDSGAEAGALAQAIQAALRKVKP